MGLGGRASGVSCRVESAMNAAYGLTVARQSGAGRSNARRNDAEPHSKLSRRGPAQERISEGKIALDDNLQTKDYVRLEVCFDHESCSANQKDPAAGTGARQVGGRNRSLFLDIPPAG